MALTVKQRRTRADLAKALKLVKHDELLKAIWAVRAIQSNRVTAGQRYIEDIPNGAATNKLTSKFAVFPWRIETLVNEMLALPEGKEASLKQFHIDIKKFAAIAYVSNKLYAAENADDAVKLESGMHILNEMHRIIQKQYDWQSGFATYPNFYRAGFLYGGPLSKAAFKKRVGADIDVFSETIFILFGAYQDNPSVTSSGAIGRTNPSDVRRILSHISLPHAKAVVVSRRLRDWKSHISYRKSLLRTWPIISFEDKFYCPLPELLILRIGSGLYYDLISPDGSVRNEISKKFESYICELLRRTFYPDLLSSDTYKVGKNIIDSPDVLIEERGLVSIIGECKATRMSFEAMFSDNPLEEAARGYNEIVKGILQIWTYSIRSRLGSTGRRLSDSC